MSLPVLHSFAGYGVCKTAHRGRSLDTLTLVVCVLLANLADCDFLPGILQGRAALFHRTASHSLLAALACGAAAGLLLWAYRRARLIPGMLMGFSAYATHLVLDLFGKAPKGLQLFWPFSERLVYGPFMDFKMNLAEHPIEKASGFESFAAALFSPGLLQSLCFELTFVFLFWSMAAALRRESGTRREREGLVFSRGVWACVFWTVSIVVRQ